MTDRWTLRLVLTRSQPTAPAVIVTPGGMVDEAATLGASIGATFATISDGGLTYRVASFPASGSLVVTGGDIDVEYLIVGGGGAGCTSYTHYGSGGGAGGVLTNLSSPIAIAAGSYPVVVGAGAAPAAINVLPANGGLSSFAEIAAFGGSGATDGQHARTGGGSAGGSMIGGAPTEGAAGQGTAGGRLDATAYHYTGGGGAAEPGRSSIEGGHGGAGILCRVTGEDVHYGGGGGSGSSTASALGQKCFGGLGGGGDGGGGYGYPKNSAVAGADGFGGGGGGNSLLYGGGEYGKRGGNGVVIVRWRV